MTIPSLVMLIAGILIYWGSRNLANWKTETSAKLLCLAAQVRNLRVVVYELKDKIESPRSGVVWKNEPDYRLRLPPDETEPP